MAAVQTYKCDRCPKQKGEVNHWYVVLVNSDSFQVFDWDEELAKKEGAIHVCGQQCLVAALSDWMSRTK